MTRKMFKFLDFSGFLPLETNREKDGEERVKTEKQKKKKRFRNIKWTLRRKKNIGRGEKEREGKEEGTRTDFSRLEGNRRLAK